MKLKQLLRLQLTYYSLGMLFNALSLILIYQGGHALTPNEPILGSIVMSIYALFLIPGFMGKLSIYRALMVLAIIMLGYGGVFNHINMIRETPELYHSIVAGGAGLMINVFGLVLNIIAALGKFDYTKSE